MSLFMNPWQKAVCETYGGGDYRHLKRNPRWEDKLDDLGDGLFTFLMIELSDTEDCEDAQTALQRLEAARDDIDQAIDQVMRLIPRN
jgi:hypothetical protein